MLAKLKNERAARSSRRALPMYSIHSHVSCTLFGPRGHFLCISLHRAINSNFSLNVVFFAGKLSLAFPTVKERKLTCCTRESNSGRLTLRALPFYLGNLVFCEQRGYLTSARSISNCFLIYNLLNCCQTLVINSHG